MWVGSCVYCIVYGVRIMMVLTDSKREKYELRHKYDGVSKEERDRLTANLRRKRKTAHEKRRKKRRKIERIHKILEERKDDNMRRFKKIGDEIEMKKLRGDYCSCGKKTGIYWCNICRGGLGL